MKLHRCSRTGHEIDLDSVSLSYDGGELYIDVTCKRCGETGCLGTAETLIKNASWDLDVCDGNSQEREK